MENRYRKIWMIVTLGILSVAVIGLILYAVFADRRINDYKNEILAKANGAFEEVVDEVSGLGTKLLKVSVSNDAENTQKLLMDLWREAGTAEASLAGLPLSEETRAKLTAYFNTTGDYAKQLSESLLAGNPLEEKDKEQLAAIKKTCRQIEEQLMDAWNKGYMAEVNLDAFIPEGAEAQLVDFVSQEYPRLIYDGPFSESTMNKEPVGVPIHKITEQEGLKAAQAFSGMEALEPGSHSDGQLPFYQYVGKIEDRDVEVSVTKQGGRILYYFVSTNADGLTILPTQAREKEVRAAAQAFLQAKGYPACQESYIQYYNGCALINMVPLQEETKLYPDLIKVWVDMETTQVVGLDTRGYLMNHQERELAEPKLTLEEAKAKINAGLTVTGTAQAVIPTETGGEKFCYEFTCKAGGEDCIVYIDCETGKEADILSIIHTNNGTLTE